MDAINVKWSIVITDNGREMGAPIPATGWDCHSKIAAIKARIPAGWQAEAYAQVHNMRGAMGEAIGHKEVITTV